jgi:hypothetical protein
MKSSIFILKEEIATITSRKKFLLEEIEKAERYHDELSNLEFMLSELESSVQLLIERGFRE